MRVLLAGKHELSVRVFQELYSIEGIVLAVSPAKTEDPHRTSRSLEIAAREANVTCYPYKEDPALLSAIQDFHPDLLLSAGYDRILREEVFSKVQRTGNIHFGALPQYRGNWSIPWAILNGEKKIGISLHEIRSGIDDGAILHQAFLPDDGSYSARELYDRAVDVGAELATSWIKNLLQGIDPTPKIQNENHATYYGRQYPGNFLINWRQTGLQVSRYIRAAHFPPYKGACTFLGSERVEIAWPSRFSPCDVSGIKPGTIISTSYGICVAVLNGVIYPTTVFESGQPKMFSAFVQEKGCLGQILE